jgi:hypothetical protein
VLALVNARIPECAMNQLADLVLDSHRLRELDISWNVGIRPKFYLPLLDALGENRSMTSINLSYNSLIDAPEELVPQR